MNNSNNIINSPSEKKLRAKVVWATSAVFNTLNDAGFETSSLKVWMKKRFNPFIWLKGLSAQARLTLLSTLMLDFGLHLEEKDNRISVSLRHCKKTNQTIIYQSQKEILWEMIKERDKISIYTDKGIKKYEKSK